MKIQCVKIDGTQTKHFGKGKTIKCMLQKKKDVPKCSPQRLDKEEQNKFTIRRKNKFDAETITEPRNHVFGK